MRIVSLLASATEIICALGQGHTLVGRSHECDNPEWVKALPACTRPAFDVSLPSAAIDAEVRRRLRAGEPLYHIDRELIAQLRPNLLIAQEHCEVCAVTPGDLSRAGCAIGGQVLGLGAGTVDGIFAGVKAIAEALEISQLGCDLVQEMRFRMDRVTDAVRGRPAPTVVMLEWIDPIFSMGNWGPELVQAANGAVLLGEKGQHSRTIPWEQVCVGDPNYLIIAPCGFDLARTRREAPLLKALAGWSELQAVKAGRVALADGNRFFNRSGMGIVETVEIIAEIIHGCAIGEGWRGRAWELMQINND